jgi:hypothetical protein
MSVRRIRDEVAAEPALVSAEVGEPMAVAMVVEASPVEDRTHEDLAQFRGMVSALTALRERADIYRDRRGRHGRRWALVSTKIEEALLQAQQGVHEAQYAQGG